MSRPCGAEGLGRGWEEEDGGEEAGALRDGHTAIGHHGLLLLVPGHVAGV